MENTQLEIKMEIQFVVLEKEKVIYFMNSHHKFMQLLIGVYISGAHLAFRR